ncbi:MazG-like family protein [Streptomyces microflavus]|uniref:MazG-like family protein n=1 Tax=Streptomyces microflavus TaxID=1919 RepID=UPI0033CBE739
MFDPWPTIDGLVNRLDAHSKLPRDQQLLLQLLKIQEETGEVAEAVIGAMGVNPRKGHSHTWKDVEAEVCDVIVTGMVALLRLNPEAPSILAQHLARITVRDLPPAPPQQG